MALKVPDCAVEAGAVVAKLAERVVAGEAPDPAHFAGVVIVVDVLAGSGKADGADATLRGQQAVDVLLSDAVAQP